ncbi:MAG: bifunctional DedA family/phosphatase PAP2 family protein [Patescibacteria group bacterium]
MHSFLAPIISHIEAIIEHGGYIALFLVTVLEGVPAIGQFVPGHTIVILSGFLAKLQVLNIYIIVPLIVLGALGGDCVAYYCGKRFGFMLLSKFGKYFFITEDKIERVSGLISKHVGKTTILGRFSPVTRPLAPFIVGASGIPFKKFLPLDLIGVLIWTSLSLSVGYIFGASYHTVAGLLGKFIVIGIILAILIVMAYRFVNKQFHIFAKYELITLVANLAGLFIFFKTVQDALSDHAFMADFDVWINFFFLTHATAVWLTFMNVITNVFSPEMIAAAGLAAMIYFIYKKSWRYAVITFSSIGGGFVLNSIMKALVMRARPETAFLIETGYSFPSGHAVAATIFFALAIYIFARRIQLLVWRELFIVVCVALGLLVGFSRIYLGVHWVSDVVAGIGFGLFWTTLMILSVRYFGLFITKFREYRRG